MGRRLVVTVYVPDSAGEMKAFGPDSTSIPAWASEQITNPDVWADDADDDVDEVAATPLLAVSTELARMPPKAGAGSGLGEWAAYAGSLGIDVPDGATRADVITLVDAVGESK